MTYMHGTTPEIEAEAAQQALGAGDLATAMARAGAALQFEPKRAEWLQLLEQVYRRSTDPLSLVPAEACEQDSIAASLRAWLLSNLGRWDEAFELIVSAAASRPDRPFLLWGADWIKKPGMAAQLPKDLIEGKILPGLARFISDVQVPMAEDDVRKSSVEAAAAILGALHVVYSDSPEVLFARSLVTRRLGNFDHASYYAYEAFQIAGTWKNAVGVALAYRDAGKIEDAISWFRHAVSLDPDDITARLEIGDTFLEAGRWDDARKAYQAVLEREAEQNWAEASLTYARFKSSGEDKHRDKLAELGQLSGRAQSLLRRLEPLVPYVDFLPPATDATANALRGVIRELESDPSRADGGTVTLSVTHPESPSVLNAFRLWAMSRGVTINVELQVDKVQSPDPRVPKSDVDFTLWQYDEFSPSPAVDAPDPRLAAAIGMIAQEPYNLERYEQKAAELREKIKLPPDAFLPHLTATMVHPPPLPSPDYDPINWIQRVQVASALLIAQLDDGWNPSVRKRALYSMIMGPVDWLVDAALVVLGWLGSKSPDIRGEAAQMFRWMYGQIPKEGYTCFEYPLACAWLLLGELDDATKQWLENWKSQIESRGRAAPDAGPEEEIHDGVTLEQYAEFSAWRDAILEQHGLGVGGDVVATAGTEVFKRLEDLCQSFGLDATIAYGNDDAGPGHIKAWDDRITSTPAVAELFFAKAAEARRRLKHDG